MKIAGWICLALCAVCLFVAWERYQDNAGKVNAINRFVSAPTATLVSSDGNVPEAVLREAVPQLFPKAQPQLQPAMPAESKYALLFAALFGVAGVVLLMKAPKAPCAADGCGCGHHD